MIHGVIHGDAQLLNAFTHLSFHGPLSVGHHHSNQSARSHSGAHAEPKPGIVPHISSLLLRSEASMARKARLMPEIDLPNTTGFYIIKKK